MTRLRALGVCVAALLSACSTLAPARARVPGHFTLWQLPQYGHSRPSMSYVVQTDAGSTWVLDGGLEANDETTLRAFLRSHGGHVEAWFITHPHQDHVTAMSKVVGAPGKLRIAAPLPTYQALPDRGWVESLVDKADRDDALLGLDRLHEVEGRLQLKTVAKGDVLTLDGIRISILNARQPDLLTNAVNNSSLAFRMEGGGHSVLFMGDVGNEACQRMLGDVRPVEYLQVAHHGQNGPEQAATWRVYDAASPHIVLWPTPSWRWAAEGAPLPADAAPNWASLRMLTHATRDHLHALGVRPENDVVSGVDSAVEVDLEQVRPVIP